jgi:hypothetical protein
MGEQRDMATSADHLRTNAELVIKYLGPQSGIDFGYNEESIAWLDQHIDDQRQNLTYDPDSLHKILGMFGCFLGECIIRSFGGQWNYEDERWLVRFESGSSANPIGKVRKLYENGLEGGDSITGFYQVIPLMVAGYLQPTQNPDQS